MTFYQQFPKAIVAQYYRLAAMFAIGFGLFFFFRPWNPAHLVVGAFMLIAAVLLVHTTIAALAIRQPMLTLTKNHLIYRRVCVPWTLIGEVTILTTKAGPHVALVLSGSTAALRFLIESRWRSSLMQSVIRESLATNGAILVPLARGMTIEGLRAVIEEARQRAAAGNVEPSPI